jgi:hemerythrin
MLMDWSDELSVAVPEIDDDHRKLLGIVNEFHEAHEASRSKEEVLAALTKIADYACWHFDHEEEIMRQEGFPGLQSHRDRHAELLDALGGLIADFEAGRADIDRATLDFLKSWVLVHLKTEDRDLGIWVRSRRAMAAAS